MKRVKPFTLLGTVVMSLGVYLLTTLDVSSTPANVELYLMVTGLGLLGQARIACGLYSPKCLVRAFSAVHLQEFGFVGALVPCSAG